MGEEKKDSMETGKVSHRERRKGREETKRKRGREDELERWRDEEEWTCMDSALPGQALLKTKGQVLLLKTKDSAGHGGARL